MKKLKVALPLLIPTKKRTSIQKVTVTYHVFTSIHTHTKSNVHTKKPHTLTPHLGTFVVVVIVTLRTFSRFSSNLLNLFVHADQVHTTLTFFNTDTHT